VAVGGTSGSGTAIETSADGATWARQELLVAPLAAIVYGNGRFVAVGDGVAMVSPDGLT
jgi:hypothetical protein